MQARLTAQRDLRRTSTRCVALMLLAVGAVSCDGSTGPRARSTFLSMESAPGDYIGQGRSWHYTLADGTWSARYEALGAGAQAVSVSFQTAGTFWHVDFAAPPGQPLRTGTYENARRFPFNDAQPGLSVDGDGRGCNELTGRFVIHDLVLGATGFVDRLRATFEQHCEGASPALTGEISVVANPWR